MKRIVSLGLIIALLCCFTGCGKADDDGKLNIVCTVFPQYDFVRNIVGDKADVKMLVPFGVESHDFKLENLTVGDINTVSSADLVVYIGGESDTWINDLKKTVSKSNIKWVALTEMVELIPVAHSNGLVSEELLDHTHHNEEYDEHVWTSPKRAKQIVAQLTDIICELDKLNEQSYRASSEQYIAEIDLLDEKMTAAVSGKTKDTLVFADRFSFRYLCTDYGLNFAAAFNGCSDNTDPSVNQISYICEKVTELNINSVFYMENSRPEFANSIAEHTGTKAVMLHSCHTVKKADFGSGAGYLSIMHQNIEKIAEALQ